MTQFSIEIQCVWNKDDGKFEEFDPKIKEQPFNMIRVTEDDQEYDFVEDNKPVDVAN